MNDHRHQPRSPSLIEKLRNRRRRYGKKVKARISWKRWLLASLTLITIAAFFFDTTAIGWVRAEPRWLHDFAADITDAGKSWWILTSAAVLGLLMLIAGRQFGGRRQRLRAITVVHSCFFVFVSVAGSGLISNVLKRVIGRARPTLIDQYGNFHFQPFARDFDFESFPSGHSTTDGALAMTLAILFPALRIPLLVLGFLLATTRTLVGVHYPSDVIAGYSFGVWFALMTATVMARFGLLFRTGLPGMPRH
jgi:membrane-associated phospholipid phosphatase